MAVLLSTAKDLLAHLEILAQDGSFVNRFSKMVKVRIPHDCGEDMCAIKR